MKKVTLYVMAALVLLSFMPTPLRAVTENTSTSTPLNRPVESPEAEALLNRLAEIDAIDKSELSPTEKKELRKEVRSIKKELREIGNGVYLSVGAIIIIVLLLILLL
ncbi:MAG: hypothetical protein RIC19_07825 [Phaeodactylibacter sp.]|uniref:hypothetical protein n=1 Tax=Phaeodactylibacter sp. TaxID=1940289 RepID=UPI0032EB52B0